MGFRDDLEKSFGGDFFSPTVDRQPYHNRFQLCVCGHLDRYHSPTVGGIYAVPATVTKTNSDGEEWIESHEFHGCVGALKPRNNQLSMPTTDREARTMVHQIPATCPCEKFRPVATVDRPNRYFNQKMPRDPADRNRHPFLTGIRAFTTHLSKRKDALKDPAWADREFDRRFTWNDGARVCSISGCKQAGDGVWPCFVNGDNLSELRCAAHR